MYIYYYSRDHFGKYVEEAKYFIYTEGYEGAKHKYNAEGYSKKTELYKHHEAKYANYGGLYIATSRRCPKKRSTR
jgi:hypothetical protein